MRGVILVTGGSGFVGSQIVNSLRARGYVTRRVARSVTFKSSSPKSGGDEVVIVDDLFRSPPDELNRICDGVDTIIHAAWFVEPGSYLKAVQNLDCLKGTISLAEAAVRSGVRRFVGIGTCFEYDDTPGLLSTATPLLPRTLYGCSKAATFMTLSGFLPQQGVEFLWCRLFYLYGAGEKPNRLFPYLNRQLSAGLEVNLTSGDQIRDFLDVEVAANEIVDSAASDMQGAVNICSGIPISVRQFAERIADQYGMRSMLRFGTRPDNLQDPPLLVGVKSVLQERTYES